MRVNNVSPIDVPAEHKPLTFRGWRLDFAPLRVYNENTKRRCQQTVSPRKNYGKITAIFCRDELYSKVRFPLRYARTVLSDQQGQYFVAESAGETLTDAAFIAYGYEDAYNRNEITVENVREAAEALEGIINRLSDFSRGLR